MADSSCWSRDVIDYIDGDECSGKQSRCNGWRESDSCGLPAPGFWQAMDTLRDKNQLEELWAGRPPWKIWE